jgi:hypothetical protein
MRSYVPRWMDQILMWRNCHFATGKSATSATAEVSLFRVVYVRCVIVRLFKCSRPQLQPESVARPVCAGSPAVCCGRVLHAVERSSLPQWQHRCPAGLHSRDARPAAAVEPATTCAVDCRPARAECGGSPGHIYTHFV